MVNSYNRKVKKDSETLALAVIVDDLDRCPKEKIMEMLKATHLLLEQPRAPMAVFLAVDPQLVTSAITASLEGLPNTVIPLFPFGGTHGPIACGAVRRSITAHVLSIS